MKGNVKEAWGNVTDNPKTKLEGKMDKAKGVVQEKLGRLEGKEAELESRRTKPKP
ncbi:MAG: CsbD family protein [Thermoanaerobaculia bacterium]